MINISVRHGKCFGCLTVATHNKRTQIPCMQDLEIKISSLPEYLLKIQILHTIDTLSSIPS